MYSEKYKGYNLKGSEITPQPRRDVLSYQVIVYVNDISPPLLVVNGEVTNQSLIPFENEVKDLKTRANEILVKKCIAKVKELIDKQDFVTVEYKLTLMEKH